MVTPQRKPVDVDSVSVHVVFSGQEIRTLTVAAPRSVKLDKNGLALVDELIQLERIVYNLQVFGHGVGNTFGDDNLHIRHAAEEQCELLCQIQVECNTS